MASKHHHFITEELRQFPETQEPSHDECQETCSAGEEVAEGHGSGEEETGVVVIDTGKRNNRRVVQHVILVNGWQGPCVVYTADSVRFKVPLAFLSTTVFAELLRMSNESPASQAAMAGSRCPAMPC